MQAVRAHLAKALQAVLDIIAAVLGVYYSKKYAVLARRLGLPRISQPARRGFIIVQIDGLSFPHLVAAIDQGYAPYLRRQTQRGESHVAPWYPGLPSTTPAAQSGIMFGNNDDIPAFRWHDKAMGVSYECTWPSTAQRVQERISRARPGILEGGSSYVNMFDGDASLSLFTLSAWNRQHFFESVRGLGFFLLFMLNPLRILKVFGLSLWEYITDLVQRTTARFRTLEPHPVARAFPLLRVVSNVVFREIQTFAVMVDIYRGVPSIYTTYYGYDELAHHYGATSKIAFKALHAIDRGLREIDSMRRFGLTRSYDLYILSDHGMTAAIPFRETYDLTLGEMIRGLVGECVALKESQDQERQEVLQALYLNGELGVIEANTRRPLAAIPQRMHHLVSERLPQDPELIETAAEAPDDDLIVCNSGSLSHVYFGVTSTQMSISAIRAQYPTLIGALLAHPGIWLVVGREGDSVVAMSNDGVASLGDTYEVEGEDPLGILPDIHRAARQLARLVRFPHAGDLVLLGRYDPVEQVVSTFEEQCGTHGGLGGPQDTAFMLVDAGLGWDLKTIGQANDVYTYFRQTYRSARLETA